MILITLILSLSAPAFSQILDADPVVIPSIEFQNRKPAVVNAVENKKKSSFMMIDAYSKVLLRQVNGNISIHCKDDQDSLEDIRGLIEYIKNRKNISSVVKVISINQPVEKECADDHYSACIFKGQALRTLSSLSKEKYLVDYLHEQKHLSIEDSKKLADYFSRLHQYLRPKQ